MEFLRVEPGGVVAAVSVEDGEYPLVLARSEEGRWVHVVHYQILVLIRRTDAAPGDAGRLAERSVRFREHLLHHRRSPGHVLRVAGRSHQNIYLVGHEVARSSAPADGFPDSYSLCSRVPTSTGSVVSQISSSAYRPRCLPLVSSSPPWNELIPSLTPRHAFLPDDLQIGAAGSAHRSRSYYVEYSL